MSTGRQNVGSLPILLLQQYQRAVKHDNNMTRAPDRSVRGGRLLGVSVDNDVMEASDIGYFEDSQPMGLRPAQGVGKVR